MRPLPRHLQLLEASLTEGDLDGGAMLPSELDGFVAGLVVCPAAIGPREWLPLALGTAVAAWPDGKGVLRHCIRLVLSHRDGVDRALRGVRGGYAPVFDVDPSCGEVLWELWADGFGRAMALRPDAWGTLAQDPADGDGAGGAADGNPAAALAGMRTLVALATCADAADPDAPPVAVLTDAAPVLIPRWVETLHGWRHRHAGYAARYGAGGGPGRPDQGRCSLN